MRCAEAGQEGKGVVGRPAFERWTPRRDVTGVEIKLPHRHADPKRQERTANQAAMMSVHTRELCMKSSSRVL